MSDATFRRAWSGRRYWLVGVGLVAVAAVVIAVFSQDKQTLTVPGRGEVSAQWLEGHPVFVVAASDGTIRVLDAVSPHSPEGFTKVLAWCASSELFEDLWHGSKFDRTGAYLGGPSPTGMAAYEVASVAHGEVRVGPKRPAPARAASERSETVLSGPPCEERTALYGPGHPGEEAVLEDLTVHAPVDGGSGLWIPTPERVLGKMPTHHCSAATADAPAGVCSDTP